MKIEPRYTHDCTSCIFLGYYHEYDLYYCDQMGMRATVIARKSSDGPVYISGMGFASPYIDAITGELKAASEPLREALHRVNVSDIRK